MLAEIWELCFIVCNFILLPFLDWKFHQVTYIIFNWKNLTASTDNNKLQASRKNLSIPQCSWQISNIQTSSLQMSYSLGDRWQMLTPREKLTPWHWTNVSKGPVKNCGSYRFYWRINTFWRGVILKVKVCFIEFDDGLILKQIGFVDVGLTRSC